MRFITNARVALGILVVAMIVGGVWFAFNQNQTKTSPKNDQQQINNVASVKTVKISPVQQDAPQFQEKNLELQDAKLETVPQAANVSSPGNVLAKPQVAEGCFTVKFTHKKISSHSDGEACLRHNNHIALKPLKDFGVVGEINPKAVCILVNGAVVKHSQFEGKRDEFLFGPVAGPKAVVTVRFCVGKSQLHEKCIVQKDDFMSALGADDGDSPGWDGSKELSKEEVELEVQAAALSQEKEEAEAKNKVFSGWIAENKEVKAYEISKK